MAGLAERFREFISTLNPGLAKAFEKGKVTKPINKASENLRKAREAIEARNRRRRERNQ